MNLDDFPDIIEADETIKHMISFDNHIFLGTERAVYIMLEEDEEWPGRIGAPHD